MSLEVSSVKIDWDEPVVLIVFNLQQQPGAVHENGRPGKQSLQKDLRIERLTDELERAKAEIHTVMESQETAYININSLLSDVEKDFEDTILQKHATIEVEKLCKVKVIPFQFRQLFHNLISNSLKFSRPDVPPQIMIKSKIVIGGKPGGELLLPNKKYCHIMFTDNGIGFDLQYKDRIFEAFQRLNPVVEFPGTGIGLAICKRIVENHNGFMTAQGKLNEGAQFDIYIPSEHK